LKEKLNPYLIKT